MISPARFHPQLALFLRRDDFFRSVSSPACSFLPQGCFLLPGFIPSLLFFSAGMISAAQFHPQLALFSCRDDFFWPDSSPASSFLPQGLFLLLSFIPSLLFSSAGIISSAQFHPQLALFLRRDYFGRQVSSHTAWQSCDRIRLAYIISAREQSAFADAAPITFFPPTGTSRAASAVWLPWVS